MRKGYFHGPKDLQKQKNHAAAVNDVMRMRGCGEVCEKTLSMNRRLFICLGQGRAIPNRAVSEPLRGNKERCRLLKCSRTLKEHYLDRNAPVLLLLCLLFLKTKLWNPFLDDIVPDQSVLLLLVRNSWMKKRLKYKQAQMTCGFN